MNKKTTTGVVVFVTALALAACSKNQSATNACATMAGSDACNSCCKANGASGYKYLGSACECLGGKSSASPPSTTSVSFAGNYRSNWGNTVFAQSGTTVTASYAKGGMTCQANGNVLTCDWRESATAYGKARLVKESNGSITGTWGSGSSATNGGPWTFTP